MDLFALVVEIVSGLLTACGIVYGLLALVGARAFERDSKKRMVTGFAPAVSILKPVKGVDPRMYAGFVSHCKLHYAGEIELLFGVRSLEDAAVAEVARLRVEHTIDDLGDHVLGRGQHVRVRRAGLGRTGHAASVAERW